MRKKNIYIRVFSVMLSLIIMMSCSEEAPIKSKITVFPTFEITGEQYSIIQLGDSYTDPGAIAKAGSETLPVTTTGNVDTNTVGVYRIDYSATNSDGFIGSSFRYVAVVDDAVAIANKDLSGSYTRDSNANHVMTLTKIADGFYDADDILPTNRINVFMVQVSSDQIIIPRQPSRFGDIAADPFDVSGSGGDLINGSDITLRTFIGCCGIFTRRFIKD
jgi:hypothetical protein